MTEIKSPSYFHFLKVKIYESRGKLLLGLGQCVHTVQKTRFYLQNSFSVYSKHPLLGFTKVVYFVRTWKTLVQARILSL